MADFQATFDNRKLFLAAVRADSGFISIDDRITRCLQVPRSLAGVWHNAGRLKKILRYWRGFDPQWTLPDDVQRWIERIESIEVDDPFRDLPILSMPTERAVRDGDKAYPSQVFKGIQRTHSVWVSQWYEYQGLKPSDDPQNFLDAYDRLVALFGASYARLADRGNRPSGESRPYEASALLFKLHGAEERAVFDQWLAHPQSIEGQYQHFRDRHKSSKAELRQGFGALADLVNEGFGLGYGSVFRKRNVVPAGRPKIRAGLDHEGDDGRDVWVWQVDLLGSDPGGFSPIPKEIKTPGKPLENQLISDGLNPLEFADDVIVWISADDLADPPTHSDLAGQLPPLGALYAAARGRQRAEVMAAQLFRTRLSRIRPIELARIIRTLNELYVSSGLPQRGPDTQFSIDQVREGIRFIAVLILTGAEPEVVRSLECFQSVEKLPKNWALAYSPKLKVWIHPYLPPDRQPLAFKYRRATVDTWPRIVRSDIWSVGQALGDPIKGRWFHQTLETYDEIFKKNIFPALIKSGADVRTSSIVRLKDLVYSWFLGSEEGDQLRVSVIFDRDAATCEAQHFYTAFDRAGLDRLYVEEMKRLWVNMSKNESQFGGTLFTLGQSVAVPKTLCGNDYVPRASSVVALVSEMKYRLSMKIYPNWSIEQHNLATAYLALGLAVVTGFRSTRTPVPDLTFIDQETGFMPLQEKDRADSAHARLVWIPPLIRRQIERYLRHLRGMSFVFPAGGPTSIKVKATAHRDRSRFNAKSYQLSLLRTMFFIVKTERGHLKTVELTGKRLMDALNHFVPDHWPIGNAGRHLLRTYLVEAGCPAVIINTLFGHWHTGEASWGPDSAFDPYSYRKTLAPYLEGLLVDLGYEEMAF